MTGAYNCYFASLWLTNILAIPTAFTLLIWGLAWYSVASRVIIGLSITLVCIVWIVYLRLHGARVLVRAGAWPALCMGDAFPTTEEELTAAAAKVIDATPNKVPPAVVGSGWGHFLYRRGPKGPRIFLHTFKGLVPGTNLWRSGTTIAEVNRALRKRGLTFKTHPTMDYISLGAWFACSNHGNGGAAAGKSSDVLKIAHVLDMKTNTMFEWEYPEVRKKFDAELTRINKDPGNAEPCRYCIVYCEFHNLAPNIQIQKRCIVVDDELSAAEWLTPTAHLRLLFLGKARDVGLGIQWVPVYDPDTTHVDPHFCSRWCNFFQVDIFSVIFGCYESSYKEVDGVKYLTAYEGRTEWYYANLWMPAVWPWQTVTVIFSGYRNFEIFFKLPDTLDGATLWRLVRELIAMHQAHSGRSEIRHGAPGGAICLDISMNRDFDAPFRLLKQQFGVTTVALHPGKMNDPRDIKTAPCGRVPIGEL